MIQITLSFNTGAEAAAALAMLYPTAPAPVIDPPKPVVEQPKPEKPKAQKPEPKAEPAEPVVEQPKPAEPAAMDYSVVQKAAFRLAAINRDAAVATAQAMGVPTFKALPPERWPEAVAAIEAKIAELEAA